MFSNFLNFLISGLLSKASLQTFGAVNLLLAKLSWTAWILSSTNLSTQLCYQNQNQYWDWFELECRELSESMKDAHNVNEEDALTQCSISIPPKYRLKKQVKLKKKKNQVMHH